MRSALYLAVGMPRAGSGWHFNLMHDLVVAGGGADAREIRRRFRLAPVLTEVNLNIRALTPPRLFLAHVPVHLGHAYTIKTHSAATPFARRLIEKGELVASYIYRDPRAVLLSALEYGERARAAGRSNAFSRLKNFDDGLAFVQQYLRIWEAWMALDKVQHVRYEDLQSDYKAEAAKLAAFLGLDPADLAIAGVIDQHKPGAAARERKGQHFQHGEADRFRRKLTKAQLATANKAFGGYLERMGYKL